MQEIWKDIKGYNGCYQVSNFGNVKSFKKSTKHPNEESFILKPHYSRGYAYVGLSINGKHKNFLVHRLVAEAFIPNTNNYPEVNHKDENPSNNRVSNLEWCTRDYNMSYGTARVRQGISCGIPVNQLTIDGICIATYCSPEIAAKINNIDPSSIHKCCKKKREFAGGYKWEYKS